MQARGEAPGKLLLFGEHAVVYQEPALGVPVARGVKATLREGTGEVSLELARGLTEPPSLHAASPKSLVDRALGPLAGTVDTTLRLAVPPMSGFGSSASIALAVLRARAAYEGRKPPGKTQLMRRALEVETVAHARPSGVDPALCLADGPLRFVRKGPEKFATRPLRLSRAMHLVVASAGPHGGTKRSVSRLGDMRNDQPQLVEHAMRLLGQCSIAGQRGLAAGKLDRVGAALDMAHGVLSGFSLVDPRVESAVRLLRERGAVGAKMSGAGGQGGALVGLFTDLPAAQKAARALARQEYVAWAESFAAQ